MYVFKSAVNSFHYRTKTRSTFTNSLDVRS
jgi:hypothetical protein